MPYTMAGRIGMSVCKHPGDFLLILRLVHPKDNTQVTLLGLSLFLKRKKMG